MKIDTQCVNTSPIRFSPYNSNRENISRFENTINSMQKPAQPASTLPNLQEIMKPQLDGTHLRNLSQYVEELKLLLNENGIDYADGFKLTVGTDGQIVADGNCPNKEKIENLIHSNKELCEKLKNQIIMQEHAEHIKKCLECNKMYAVDTKAAVAKYGYLLNNNYNIKVILDIGQDSFKVEVKETF